MGRFLWILAVILIIVWLVTYIGFKIASGLIHLLLGVAVILIIINLFTAAKKNPLNLRKDYKNPNPWKDKD